MTVFSNYHLPRAEEIPDLELYMDQVIIYVKKYFSIFPYGEEKNFITSSMINNYVKSGIIPPPDGKKYSRRHIAYIFVVFFLKQIFPLDEVKAFIVNQVSISGEEEAYKMFCEMLENELRSFSSTNKDVYKTPKRADALHHATISIANKLYAQSLIRSFEN